jgi:sugar-specific transcriptional regulator TrmB
MSAQRLKNNDLQNRIAELNSQMEKLKEENRTLKRVHHREENALKRLESQDNDVTRLIRNHMEESNALKEIIKTVKTENQKLSKILIDKDEDARNLKKKLDEYKKILNDKKLLDSAELSKRLEQCEKDLTNSKLKCEVCAKYKY